MSSAVLVYGTLRAGQHNSHYLQSAVRLFDVIVPRCLGFRMHDMRGYYPYLIKSVESSQDIAAEVYEIDLETLQRLDRLESLEDGDYTRERLCKTELHLIQEHFCGAFNRIDSVHFYLGSAKLHSEAGAPTWSVPDGDWVAYCQSRASQTGCLIVRDPSVLSGRSAHGRGLPFVHKPCQGNV